MAVGSELLSPLGPPPACEKDAKALRFIEEMTRNVDLVQERVLAEILSRNAETEYPQRFNICGETDRETLKSKLPVIRSGTSAGERKLMPTIQEELDRRQLLYSLLMPVMNLYVPGLDKGKGLYFLFVKSETKTPGGLLARPVLTSYYKSEHFKTRPFDPFNVYTSPNEAILCPDSFQSMYTQMLCGLLERKQVLRVGAVDASGLLRAIRFLQLNWAQITHDIRTGRLSQIVTDPNIRDCVAGMLQPDPDLADFITAQCSNENWEGIITRIGPNAKKYALETSKGREILMIDECSPARNKYALEILMIDRPNKKAKVEEFLITFTQEEAEEVFQFRNDPLIISSIIANCMIRNILVDTGSSVDILYLKAFEKINIEKDKLQANKSSLVGFTGKPITPLGSIVLPITLGEEPYQATEMVKFLVVDSPSEYSAILGRPSLNKFQAVPSTYHMRIKFPTENGVGCVKGNQKLLENVGSSSG